MFLLFRNAESIGSHDQDVLSPEELKKRLVEKEQQHFNKDAKGLLSMDPEQVAERRKMLENVDADDTDSESDDEDDSEDSDDEDDTLALMRELDKIKRERQQEQERIEQERLAQEQQEAEQRAVTGNPLLSQDEQMYASGTNEGASFSVKRRWDDDVIFKNQGKDSDRPKKRFINDMLRSDFHRKFMDKYVK